MRASAAMMGRDRGRLGRTAMTIASILLDKGHAVVTIDAAARLGDAVAVLAERGIGALLVLRGGDVAGVLSERDIVRALARYGAAVLDSPVEAVMSAPVVTVGPTDSVECAMALMTERRFRHLPVVESGALVGIVSIGDLVKRQIEDVCREAAALKDYIAMS
jgi:CBS domain-containing protein